MIDVRGCGRLMWENGNSGYGNSNFQIRLLEISLLITYVQDHMSSSSEGELHPHISSQRKTKAQATIYELTPFLLNVSTVLHIL